MTEISKDLPVDLSKGLNEWALAAGRYLQSDQTEYIHHFYGEEERQGAQTIPLVENALFILALFRSRMVEQIQEAKILLTALLAFQNVQEGDSRGNFPVYLHEYPLCRDSALGLHLLAPFYWILKQFGHVLGADLKVSLEQAIRLALEHSVRFHRTQPFPYSLAVRLAAAQCAYGCLWGDLEGQQQGKEELERLAERQLEGWESTAHLAHLLVGLQMVYPSILHSPWEPLWRFMEKTWHHPTGSYIGPSIREWQEGEEPQPNLYDLYGGYFSKQFSRRATLLRPYHLYGVLVRPTSDQFQKESSLTMKGNFKQQSWLMVANPEWAYTVLEKKEPCRPMVENTFTPFRLIWGDIHRMHSLVCQGGKEEGIEYVVENQSIQLIFDLRDRSDEENQVQREVQFFLDFHPDFLFAVNGHSANTFELGEQVRLSFGKKQFVLVFDLLQGEGQFLGHFMRGNRPSQIHHKGDKRFQAYDWTFFLRTIRRRGPCRLRATLIEES